MGKLVQYVDESHIEGELKTKELKEIFISISLSIETFLLMFTLEFPVTTNTNFGKFILLI